MSQISLPFDWSGHDATAVDSFLVSDANQLAVRHLERWSEWPVAASVLSGPSKSGRSTLGRQFTRLSGGTVIDDADGAGDEVLFHAWNRAQLDRQPLLLIAQAQPQDWTVALPDFRSRLTAMPHVRIEEPDDTLVRALIERGLASSGAPWSPDVVDWLPRRIERSYAAIADILGYLQAQSLSQRRKISVPFAKEALQGAGFSPMIGSDPEP